MPASERFTSEAMKEAFSLYWSGSELRKSGHTLREMAIAQDAFVSGWLAKPKTFQVADLAEGAYSAYGRSTGNKNFRGEEMPKWEDLPESIRAAWSAAARFVFDRVA